MWTRREEIGHHGALVTCSGREWPASPCHWGREHSGVPWHWEPSISLNDKQLGWNKAREGMQSLWEKNHNTSSYFDKRVEKRQLYRIKQHTCFEIFPWKELRRTPYYCARPLLRRPLRALVLPWIVLVEKEDFEGFSLIGCKILSSWIWLVLGQLLKTNTTSQRKTLE